MTRARERGDGGGVRHRRRLDRGGGPRARARVRDPGRLPGQRQRGRAALAGRPAGPRARAPGCSTPARASAGRPAGWRPSAGCGRSAPSRWPRPSGPAAGCSGCRRWSPSSQQLPFADGAFDAAWCLGVLCTTSDKAGALRRAAPGAGRRRAGSGCWSSSPTARSRRRCRRATSSRPRPSSGGCWPTPASGWRRPRRPTSATARRSGRAGPTPSRPRWPAGTARTRRSGRRRSSPAGSAGCWPTAPCGPGSGVAVATRR